MRKYAWLVMGIALAVTASGCQDRERLAVALAEAEAASAQKDSLLNEILETTQFVSDVNAELAKVKGLAVAAESGDPGVPGAEADREARTLALDRLKQAIAKLEESEAKLAEAEQRARQSRQRNARLLAQIETFKQTVADLRTAAEQQRLQYESIIADQQDQIVTLSGRVDTLAASAAALTDTITTLTTYKNQVHYAVGTEDELLERGVVVKEGSKFLFFGSTRLEPARIVVPEAFMTIDKSQVFTIPLPQSDKKYKIVSRHNPDYVALGVTQDGKLTGDTVRIGDPDAFWSVSKYLILVED